MELYNKTARDYSTNPLMEMFLSFLHGVEIFIFFSLVYIATAILFVLYQTLMFGRDATVKALAFYTILYILFLLYRLLYTKRRLSSFLGYLALGVVLGVFVVELLHF